MYENTKVKRLINYKMIFLIFSIFIILIILILLLSNMNNLNKKDNIISKNVINDNIKLLEESGINYFKNNKIPDEIGQSIIINAKYLISNHYLSSLANECNLDNSHVKLTKYSRSNFNLNTKLVCKSITKYLNKDLTFDKVATTSINNEIINDNIKKQNDNIVAYVKTKYYKHIKYSEWQVGITNEKNSETKIITEIYYYYCKNKTSIDKQKSECILSLENDLYSNYFKYYAYYIDLPYYRTYQIKWSKSEILNGYTNTQEFIIK